MSKTLVRIEARLDRDDENYVNAIEVPEADVDTQRREFARLYGYAAVVKDDEPTETEAAYSKVASERNSDFQGYPAESENK